jgi:hypothetical protein
MRRLAAIVLAAVLAAPPLPAFALDAQPTRAQQQEAATRFEKGLDLFRDGDYQAALIEFRRANELAPNFNVLYNIGQVSFELQDYAGALTALEGYLSEGGSRVSVARKAEVLRDIEELRARVATIAVVSTVPDAEVTLDDVTVGKTPLPTPILVSAGRHKITVSKAGFTAATRVVEIASGDAPRVALEPAAEPKAAPPPLPLPVPLARGGPVEQPKPPEPPPPPPLRPVPVAGIVTTGTLAVGSVITGILALSASSTLRSDRQSPDATHDQLTSASTKTTALALASDACTASAVVAFGVTLYVGLRARKDAGNEVRLIGSF